MLLGPVELGPALQFPKVFPVGDLKKPRKRGSATQTDSKLLDLNRPVSIAATGSTFALFCCGGYKIITWSNADSDSGGDNSAVQSQSKGVQQIQATSLQTDQ